MRVAVSGAGGFIGRHVVAQLEQRGISPTLAVRPGSDREAAPSQHHRVGIDITDPPADAYDRLGRPQVLIHLAWGGLPNYSSADHLERELPAHLAFITSQLAAGLGGLAVAGSCLEYGLQSGALREDLPTAPVTAYGMAKDQLRSDLENLHRLRPFSFTWARLFYLHGEGQAAGSLVPQLEAAIARGDATFDMSGGEQLRDYLPVEDAASYLVQLALNGKDNGVVNVCAGVPISIRELVDAVIARHHSPIKVNLGRYPYPEYEPMAFWGDRSKLARCLSAMDEPV